ncbi:S8 family serine peptidase [Chromobacterium haemolyticum]|uniref:S8 family serine peptidase n=1 Tax=Chromobacterium haemolyticum TaxID=394935 RepID=UPI000304FB95|nr:S8 family serine peptidase [Chromobacterium haemolyticum]
MRIHITVGAVSLALASLAGQAATPLQAGDPLVSQQWFLQNTGQNAFSQRGGLAGIDLNLALSHSRSIQGRGVTVTVIDDGLEIRHPDLAGNVVPGSKNLANNSDDPTPSLATDSHGTAVAGIAAAVGFNNLGGRGVAPAASLNGFNWLKAQTTAGWMLSHGKSPSDGAGQSSTSSRVFNQSYGSSAIRSIPGNPDTDMSLRVRDEAHEDVSLRSNGGKGAVFVKSAGNAYVSFQSGSDNDGKPTYVLAKAGNDGLPIQDSNLTTDNSNYWNVVVSALNADGVRSSYSSVGANVLLTSPGGEYGTASPAMVTTDLVGCDRGSNSTLRPSTNQLHGGTALDPNCDYRGTMNGTSAAAPAASGSFALLMSAYPSLSARDVRDLLIKSARKVDANHAGVTLAFKDAKGGAHSYQALPGWQNNAAGLAFHPFYGFGLIDVDKAVELGRNHKPLAALEKTRWQTVSVMKAIPDASEAGLDSVYTHAEDLTVEAVQVLVDAKHGRANDLAVELISPAGTRSVLLSPRTGLVNESYGLNQQRLLSNHFYGESARGQWRLRVIDTNGAEYYYDYRDAKGQSTLSLPNAAGTLRSWSIRFIGHKGA